jgi:glutamate-5-semialdehyde dehydrogenase
MEKFLQDAKESSKLLRSLSGAKKNIVLRDMATALQENRHALIKANSIDMQSGKSSNLSEALMDRLLLNDSRVNDMSMAIEQIASLKDPVGKIVDGWVVENGLKIEKTSTPIGVIGIIYESRPNVTSDSAALCFKSSNVSVLKGGKEAINSNRAIAKVLQDVLKKHNLPTSIISLIPDSSREGVDKLIKMDRYVDLIIPRGGESLIKYINKNATVSVIKHDKGQCHIYIDKDAQEDMALDIAINAKTQRPGVCNAMETLLVDKAIAAKILPLLKVRFDKEGTSLKGCESTKKYIEVQSATKEDYATEYLANILNIRVVDGVDGAIEHISSFGSGHSEAIISENVSTAETFLNSIDASCIYLNASTRFTDGGAFGFGAEVGISTNKLHARGPMGIEGLTTYKYKIYGSGQVR